jgi:flagellar biogenesis protein FliO
MKGANVMEVLIPLGILVAWVVLQAWVLPRFGVET